MIDFMLSCFDLLFNLLKTNSLLVVLPFCAVVVAWLFLLVFRLVRGQYY